MPPIAVEALEAPTYYDWITDTSVDDQGACSSVQDAGFKKASMLIHNLIDNVSKKGYLLLNVGPRENGSILPEAQDRLIAMGKWLEVNGEAIFETICSTPPASAGLRSDGPFDR